MKKIYYLTLAILLLTALTACGVKSESAPTTEATIATTETTITPETEATNNALPSEIPPDGVYTVDVDTDSSMFHVNEALDGKGRLTVENGNMMLHVTLAGKGYSKLCLGTVEDARQTDAPIIDFTEDQVVYPDGYEDSAYGFDIPIQVIGAEFPIATFGKKSETWKNHSMTVSNPVAIQP